jgi:tetratricopeptide (TPR) repeat protein
MKDLLADRDSPIQRPRLFERKGKQSRAPQATSEEVLQELEEEFGLDQAEGAPAEVRADLKGTTESDQVDLGIAFMEMGLSDQAITLLRAALELIERKAEPSSIERISTVALLARAYLLAGRSYDAIHLLHAVLRDAEIVPNDKIEFFYLMGMAYEKAGDRKAALPWYGKVRELNPQYRDVIERLRKPIT